ncbi:hypothetical protein A4V01_12710 [Erysipelotrichaceae bacterium I46]|nr:hypothetical protein A4V01_12710 [Erysipelotrichaceae bacterium I46]
MKLRSGELIMLMNGLSNVQTAISPKVNYNVSRNKKILMDEIKEYQDEITKLQKKHCKLDKNGELVTKEKSNEITFKSKEDKTALTTAINEINNTECELPIRMIKLDDISVSISQAEMDALEFMIEEESDK